MPDRMQFPKSDPRHHTAKLVIEHAREGATKVSDPKAQALFETTAEVLEGLQTAYCHFEEGNETAWRNPGG